MQLFRQACFYCTAHLYLSLPVNIIIPRGKEEKITICQLAQFSRECVSQFEWVRCDNTNLLISRLMCQNQYILHTCGAAGNSFIPFTCLCFSTIKGNTHFWTSKFQIYCVSCQSILPLTIGSMGGDRECNLTALLACAILLSCMTTTVWAKVREQKINLDLNHFE